MIPAQIQRNIDTAITVPKMQALVTQMQSLFATNTNPTLRGYSNFDEWYVSRPRLREILGGSWRVELLNQYMYLISAPFLAIVTYYILDLLGLSKPGVVVVLSTSGSYRRRSSLGSWASPPDICRRLRTSRR